MRSSFLQISLLVFGSLFVGMVLAVWADKLSPSVVLAAPVAIAVAFVVVRHPFLGLVALVSYVQTRAIGAATAMVSGRRWTGLWETERKCPHG